MAQITLTIPNNKLDEFKAGFLAMCPVPMVDDPHIIGKLIPEFTELQWFKEWIKRDVIRAYRHGKVKLSQEAAVIDEDVIE